MNLFDLIGPVMIGPSSSHTAGAARIGRVARQLLGEKPVKAVVSFHGNMKATKVAYNGAEVAAVISTEALKRVNEDGEVTPFDIAGETEIHEIFTEAVIEKQVKVLRKFLNEVKSPKAKAFRGFVIDHVMGRYTGEQVGEIFGLTKKRVAQAKAHLLKALRK